MVYDGGRYRQSGEQYTTLEKSERASVRSTNSRTSRRTAPSVTSHKSLKNSGVKKAFQRKTTDPRAFDMRKNFRNSLDSFTSRKSGFKPQSRGGTQNNTRGERSAGKPDLKASFGTLHKKVADKISVPPPAHRVTKNPLSRVLLNPDALKAQGTVFSRGRTSDNSRRDQSTYLTNSKGSRQGKPDTSGHSMDMGIQDRSYMRSRYTGTEVMGAKPSTQLGIRSFVRQQRA